MKPLMAHVLRDHVLLGGAAAVLLYPLWGFWPAFAFWLANILIDVDHYIHFLVLTRFEVLDFGTMFRLNEQAFQNRHRPDFLALEIFHTVEFLFVLGMVAFWLMPWLQPVFWGMLFHNLVDLVHLGRYGVLTKRTHSFMEYWIRSRRIRSRGGDPNLAFQESWIGLM